MTLVRHELHQGRASFWIWTASIGALLAVCIFLFPEMGAQTDSLTELFSSMGSFSEAFGMDRLHFGTFCGFYAIECGNILGLGGAFYAAICSVVMLSKEEKEKTAEFLLTHPVSRQRIVTEKLAAVLLQITAMNLLLYALCAACAAAVGETLFLREMILLHTAYFLLQLQLACICFGLSSFLRRGGAGAGIGVAVMMYCLNLIANIAPAASFLAYITPFGYCQAADLLSNGSLNAGMIAAGAAMAVCFVAAAYRIYTKKDIH